jgi:hypothetical protein
VHINTFSGTVDLDWSREWQVERAMETAVDLAAMANLGKELAWVVVSSYLYIVSGLASDDWLS